MELPDVPLFRGLTADEAEAAVAALWMRRRAFAKGEILLEAGQRAPALGVVLAGRVHILNAYKSAVENRYRFFSFGDAMFIADGLDAGGAE